MAVWMRSAGGRVLVRAFVPYGNDIYPESDETYYDPSKKTVYGTVPDLPIGPGSAKIGLTGIKILIQQKGIWKHAVNGRVASKETLKAAGLIKPELTTSTKAAAVSKEFEETLSGVPNKTGPMTVWEKIKHIIAVGGQLEF